MSPAERLRAQSGTERDRWAPPAEFEEYRILRPLGRGRTGQVYLARDTLLERAVAVKFIRAMESADLGRFLVEARAAARLQHPNVLTLYRVGQLEDRPFLVSEFVRGMTLDLVGRPMPWERVLRIGIDLARGLAAAHRAGVLHRDLKPANAILAESGEVKLLDFGLAKLDDRRPAGEAPASAEAAWLGALALRGLVGTPYFMSPEAWAGEELTARSDLYGLGAVLFELAAGQGPFRDVPLERLAQQVRAGDPPSLAGAAPGVEPRFAEVVDRCLRKEPLSRFSSAEELLEALEALADLVRPVPVPEGNPYRGLEAFGEEHRALFFGRRRDVRAVVERLRARGLLVVTGDSGVGKSSLCLAGVLPEVRDGALHDGRQWQVVRMVPGRRPVAALAAALAEHVGVEEGRLEALVRQDPGAVLRAARAALGQKGGVLLYVDQLEELVTLSVPEDAAPIGELFGQVTSGLPGLRVVGSARSDFLTRLGGVPGLGEQLSSSLYLLRPLGREEVREAITGPARVKGLRFESEALVEALVESTLRTEGGLPLLQFALAELWESRDSAQGLIRAEALETVGGVSGALARYADGVLAQLLPDQQAEARRVLTRLVTLDGTRARRTRDELVGRRPMAPVALEALIRARLVVARQSEEGITYDIAHEALLTGWSTLAGWLIDAAEQRELHGRVERAAAEWARLGAGRQGVWTRLQLAEVQRLDPELLSSREREFLEASRRAAARGRLFVRLGAVAVVLAVGLAYGSARLRSYWLVQRQVQAQLAIADEALVKARRARVDVRARRAAAFQAFDDAKVEEGNRLWSELARALPAVQEGYGAASDALERAVVLDPSRAELKDRFAELLAERADLEERLFRFGERDKLVQRLALYDGEGERVARWRTPLSLHLRTSPPGAKVSLARQRAEPDGTRVVEPARVLGRTPLERVSVERGAYLLQLELPGRPKVHYPLLADGWPGPERTLEVPLPEAVPEGFVFVPAGSFLFGTAADESIRQFFNAAPLHPVETGPYLIGRYEVTWGEYLEYLRALPEKERRLRLPRPATAAAIASVNPQIRLTFLPDGRARLRFQPNAVAYEATSGEDIRYRERTDKAEHDWLRLPVGGVTFDDARAFAEWLSRTGRLPGARLCNEWEWERAARGADDREFPHGDKLAPSDANHDATYGKVPAAFGPDEVGSHPASRSPFGLDDMSGNVFEWVRGTLVRDAPVARGGSYYFAASTCRVTNRESPEPGFRDLSVGFRLCADVQPWQPESGGGKPDVHR